MGITTTFMLHEKEEDGLTIYTLENTQTGFAVSVIPQMGNNAFKLMYEGSNLLWFPFETIAEFVDNPRLCGIPLLAPWANRLDRDGILVGKQNFELNTSLNNFSRDENGLPIHGLLSLSPHWKVISSEIAETFVELTSKLEFWKYPNYMSHFPFAHELMMSYILQNNMLTVILEVTNLSEEAMPVHLGFHPYFQFPNTNRTDWKFSIPALDLHQLDGKLLPTGKTEPNPFRRLTELKYSQLDDVFSNIPPEARNFVCNAGPYQLHVEFGETYPVAVVYAPASRDVICFEPMTALTNAINDYATKQEIKPLLQIIEPNQTWKGDFSVTISVND